MKSPCPSCGISLWLTLILTIAGGLAVGDRAHAATHAAVSPVFTLDTRNPPDAPTGLQASQGKYIHKVWLTWTAAAGATNYLVYRAQSDTSAAAEQIGQGAATSFADTQALPGVTYYYWVKAVNPAGAGNFSVSANGYRRRASGMTSGGDGDYDGDGIADIVTYDAATGTWVARMSGEGYAIAHTITGWGGPGYVPVPADYDGDGRMDPAVYAEATGTWKLWQSSTGYNPMITVQNWGGPGYAPVPADYDGDGKADPGVYAEATGTWWVWMSGSGYAKTIAPNFGGPGYMAVPADYDADGKADPGVYTPAGGQWQVWMSGSGYGKVEVNGYGGAASIPVPADYDGDGKADPSAYDESAGIWRAWPSAMGYQPVQMPLGGPGYAPIPADYDGDGRTDLAVYSEATGEWRARLSRNNYIEQSVRW